MKKNRAASVGMLAFVGAVTTVIAAGVATAGGAGGKPCFRGECLDVWRPVLCPDGNIYSNDCYALKACQRNCVRVDGPLE